MRNNHNRFFYLTLLSAICLLLGSSPILAAQKVPISFDKYHGYTGTVKYIKSVAAAYPEITDLLEIGKSTLGRPLYVLVISNQKNGATIDKFVELRNMRKEGNKNVRPQKSYEGKPGHWICGSTHGNEFTGTEVCLYTIDKLVSGYGSDNNITDLIDEKTFYICPTVNPDGVYNSVEKGMSQRYNSMEKDDDNDGRINEDGFDDLNGDGFITQFRYPDKNGRYVIDDEDPRLMHRLGQGEKTDQVRYSVIMEDKDNDGDGKRGEDSEMGIDLNRNFPEGWFKEDDLAGGSGDYPTSSPEVHAIAEFFTQYPNILMAQNYHTSGGFTYRVLGTAPHTSLQPKDVAVFDFIMGKKYLEIIGEEVPEAWLNPNKLDEFKARLKETSKNKYAIMRGYELPRGWRVSYNEAQDRRYSYGMASDWMYMQYGIYAITTELWNPRNDIPDFPELSQESSRTDMERAMLKYQDEKYGGRLFLPWKKFKHPELGEGEIGGWLPAYRSNAWPGEPLLSVCEKHCAFELFRAGLLPELEITDVQAKVLRTVNNASDAAVSGTGDEFIIEKGRSKGKYRIIEVTAKVANLGPLATHIARGSQLARNREDVIWLIGDRDKVAFIQGAPYMQLGVMEGQMKIPGYSGRRGGPPSDEPRMQRMSRYYPMFYPQFRRFRTETRDRSVKQTGPTREIKWLIAVEGNPPLKVVLTSQKGGTKVKDLVIQ